MCCKCFMFRQKGGQTLKPSDKLRIGREGSTAILEIDGAELADAGEYICVLTNDAGKATSKAGLTVQGRMGVRRGMFGEGGHLFLNTLMWVYLVCMPCVRHMWHDMTQASTHKHISADVESYPSSQLPFQMFRGFQCTYNSCLSGSTLVLWYSCVMHGSLRVMPTECSSRAYLLKLR